MAIAFTNLGVSTGTTEQAPDIRDITDLSTYTIPSWDPPDDGIVLLCIFNGQAGGQVFVDSVLGNGDTWEPIHDIVWPSGTEIRACSIFGAFGADLTTGATTIDYAGQVQILCYVSIFHITGADESGTVVNAFAQFLNGEATSTGVTIDFPAAANADNRAVAFVAHNANEAISDDATWTKMDDMNGAGPAVGMITAVDEGGVRDPAFTWTTNAAYGYLALEVKIAPPAAPPETPKFAWPPRRVPKRLFGPGHVDDIEQILYTVPAGIRAMVRNVHVQNPSGGVIEFTLAIGDINVPGNKIIFESIPGGGDYRRWPLKQHLNPGETLQTFAGQAGTLVLTVDGFEEPAG